MTNNLFEFWPTVLKVYLKEKGYRDDEKDLDLILQGDLYYLPQILDRKYNKQIEGENQEESKEKKYEFFEDLFKHINEKAHKEIENEDCDLSSSKIRDYHNIFSNSSYQFDKRIKIANHKVFEKYVQGVDFIKIRPAVIDRTKVFGFLGLTLLTLVSLLYRSCVHEPMISIHKKRGDSLETYKSMMKMYPTDSLSKIFSDKYSLFYEMQNHPLDMAEGVWYSYNSSGGKKKGANKAMPYDMVKWLVTKNGNFTRIERHFNSGSIQTKSYGFGETIGNNHYFHLNIINKKNKYIGRREYVCKSISDSDENEDSKHTLKLQCLCMIHNTDGEGEIELSYVCREIFVYQGPMKNRAAFDTIKTPAQQSIGIIPNDIRNYFTQTSDSLMFITK